MEFRSITPHLAGPVLRGMWDYKQTLESEYKPVTCIDADALMIEKSLRSHRRQKVIGEYESRMLLDAYGIHNVPGDLARADEAVRIAEEVGYPVVLKIVAEGLIHKSDAGGIGNTKNSEDARSL